MQRAAGGCTISSVGRRAERPGAATRPAHKLRTGRDGADLVFGRSPSLPFTPGAARALAAWKAENAERAEQESPLLVPIGLHELRHSYVSLMHDAGFSLERIGDYVGHSSAWMTDRYRHLLAGHDAEAAERFEAYLSGRPLYRQPRKRTAPRWRAVLI
jgi:integrase